MSNTKHTPKPWEISENNKTGFYSTVKSVITGRIVAVIPGTSENSEKTLDNYDLKLVATAPELLENLIRCVDRLEENHMGDMSAVRRAKEAIKKATE